jgi:hypothetical protein
MIAVIRLSMQVSNHDALNQLFSNFSWTISEPVNIVEEEIVHTWEGPLKNVFVTLALFIVMRVRHDQEQGGGGLRCVAGFIYFFIFIK